MRLAALKFDAGNMTGRGVGAMQVRQMTDQEGFIADCLGAVEEAALDLQAVAPKQLCFLAFLPNILDTKACPPSPSCDRCCRARCSMPCSRSCRARR